jgi:hypothetical protein
LALSVREYPNPEPSGGTPWGRPVVPGQPNGLTPDGSERPIWGTLLYPRPLELNLSLAQTSSGPDQGEPGWPFATTVLRTTLGFEAMPSTDFWLFKLERETRLRAERISQDPYAVHVAVALINAFTNRRVESLVHSQDGIGPEVLLPPGTYKLVVALGLPEVISKIEIRLHAQVEQIRMTALAHGRGTATLRWRLQRMVGIARGRGTALLRNGRRRVLVGIAAGTGEAAGRIGLQRLLGRAWGVGDLQGHLARSVVGVAWGTGAAAARFSSGKSVLFTWGQGAAVGILSRPALFREWENQGPESPEPVVTRGALKGHATGRVAMAGRLCSRERLILCGSEERARPWPLKRPYPPTS